MGAHSTIRVTRTAARQYILARFLTMDDREMEKVLDAALDERLYNVRIVDDDDDENDDCLL